MRKGQAPDGQHGTSSRQRRAYLLGNRVRPQGTTPGVLNIDSTAVADMYEPNQFVMNCGIVDPTAGPIRFSSPVSRNLNNGDSIALLLRQTSTNTMGVDGTVRYAITLN